MGQNHSFWMGGELEMIPGFSGLESELVAPVFRLERLPRGSFVFYPDDVAESLYVVAEGWARLFSIRSESEEVTVAVLGRGQVFGEAALRQGQSYGNFCETITDLEIYSAQGKDLLELARIHPEVGRALARLLSERIGLAQGDLVALRFKDVLPRVARAVLTAMQPSEGGFEVTLSHQDLAYLAFSTRETVTKALGDLAFQGILELGYRRIMVVDLEALRRAAAGK